jgi:hypothetical protein
MQMVFPSNYIGKEGIMPCGLKEQSSNTVNKVDDGDNSGWKMAFQHANDFTQVEAPSPTIVWEMFYVNDIMA